MHRVGVAGEKRDPTLEQDFAQSTIQDLKDQFRWRRFREQFLHVAPESLTIGCYRSQQQGEVIFGIRKAGGGTVSDFAAQNDKSRFSVQIKPYSVKELGCSLNISEETHSVMSRGLYRLMRIRYNRAMHERSMHRLRSLSLLWLLLGLSAIHAEEILSIPALDFSRTRVGNRVEIRGVLQNCTEAELRVLDTSLKFLSESKDTLHTESLKIPESLTARRAVRLIHRVGSMESFHRYQVQVRVQREGKTHQFTFEGSIDGGAPKLISIDPATESKPEDSHPLEPDLIYSPGNIAIHIHATRPIPILVAKYSSRSQKTSDSLWFLLDDQALPTGVSGHYRIETRLPDTAPSPSVQIFAAQLHPFQQSGFSVDSLSIGQSRFALLDSGGAVGFLSFRSKLPTELGKTRIVVHCRGTSGAVLDSREVVLKGKISPNQIVPFTVHFPTVSQFESFDYQIEYEPPLPEDPSTVSPQPVVHRLDRVTRKEPSDSNPEMRIGLEGTRYIYRRVRKGRNWVYRGGVFFLKILPFVHGNVPGKPLGTLHLEVRSRAKLLARIRRKITPKSYSQLLSSMDDTRLDSRKIFYDSSKGILYVPFLQIRETQPLDFRLEVDFQSSENSARWKWNSLHDPYIELPRVQGESN